MKQLLILVTMNFLAATVSAQTPEEVLAVKGIVLPSLPTAAGNYASLVRSGNLIYLSGRGPLLLDGKYWVGKLGNNITLQDGYTAARLCAIIQIAALKATLGTLSKVKRIVKVTGFINSTDSFTEQPKVLNGCSDLMVEVFGSKGVHARSAVSVAALPGGWPVEVEMIVEVED